jgi:glycosyltransferase involved in cell wall biosynthesis
VGGIPWLIEDGKCGLLFDAGNCDDLSRKLEIMLSNEESRRSMAESAYDRLQKHYLEEHYLAHYIQMINSVIHPQATNDQLQMRSTSSSPCGVC